MNLTFYRPSPHPSRTLNPSHPERSLAENEANRQTESKDPYYRDTPRSTDANFRIVVRFLDEHEPERRPAVSREAAAWESPARQCRVCEGRGTSPAGTALLNKWTT
jgi:hypothetical protein